MFSVSNLVELGESESIVSLSTEGTPSLEALNGSASFRKEGEGEIEEGSNLQVIQFKYCDVQYSLNLC